MRAKRFIYVTMALLWLPIVLLFGESYAKSHFIVAGDANFPPIEYLENNRPKGLNVELWQELSKAMGRRIEIQLMLWKDAQQKVLNGEADALTLLGPTEERKKLYDFSEPWLEFEFCFFVRSPDVTVHTINDLEGRIAGVTEGGYAREILEPNKNISLRFIKNNLEGFQLLASNKIDAVATDKWVGAYTLLKYGIKGIKLVEKPFAKNVACIPVKKGDLKLLNEINLGISKLMKDGTIQQILDKWSPKEVVFFTKEKIYRIIIFVSIAFLAAAIALIMMWIFTLKKQVRDKTKLLEKANNELMEEIAERKLSEEALRESEERYRAIFEQAAGSIVLADTETGALLEFNEMVHENLGFTREEFENLKIPDFEVIESAEEVANHIKKIIKEGADIFETKHRTKSGEIRDIHVSSRSISIGGKNFVQSIWRDVSEMKQAEEALRESEERLKALIDNAPDGIYLIDPITGRFLDGNRKTEELVGYPREELIGKNFVEAGILPEEYIPKTMEGLEKNRQGQLTGPDEYELIRKDGSRVFVEIMSFPVARKGKVEIIGIARDINERKRAEEEQKKLQAQLQETRRMQAIATLAGGIAHEFNNTLVGITGNIDLLQMGLPGDEHIDKYAQRMKASALHMAHLTDQLLAYAQGGKYQPKNISLSNFVKETLPLIKQTIASSIRLETDLLHDILNVEADLTQMQMVLSAILNNSAEAIEEEGRIRITTRDEEIDEEFAKNHPGLKPGIYLSLTVEDDGKGMDEETRAKIFDPFFTTKLQGRGLGMAAVYGIVTNYGGWISVDSELGKGTVVRIYLPAVKVEVKEEERPKIEPTKDTGTILVIEDEDIVIDVICAMLERLGYRVLLARTGKEAVNIVKSFDADIDLAILDILLPDLAAKEVYTEIMEARPNLKVIVCSGYAIDGPPQEILDAGAQDFIQKPFSYATISEKLKEVLEGK